MGVVNVYHASKAILDASILTMPALKESSMHMLTLEHAVVHTLLIGAPCRN